MDDNIIVIEQPPEAKATVLIKLKRFFVAYWRGVVVVVTPMIFLPFVLPWPGTKHGWCGYCLTIMATFWVTECIPLPITSFLPVLIFPLSGVMNTVDVCNAYCNDTIIMCMGSLILAYAVEQSGLHHRLALWTIRRVGYSHYKLLFALCLVTLFISFWISNTATTTLMVPINFALLEVFEEQNLLTIFETNSFGEQQASPFTTCYLCAATYIATMGGSATVISTGTNLAFRGLFMAMYPEAPEYLTFPNFSAFSLPFMFTASAGIYVFFIIRYFGWLRPKSKAAKRAKITDAALAAAKDSVEKSWNSLGKITYWEISVILLFLLAMCLFVSRSPHVFPGWGDRIEEYFERSKYIRDSVVAIAVGFMMLLLPSHMHFFKNFTAKSYDELPKGSIKSILSWTKMAEVMPFTFMFLLGGGFALSKAAGKKYSDLNTKIGQVLKGLDGLPNLLVLFIIIMFICLVTNFSPNIVIVSVIAPIVMQLAEEINQNPLWYDLAAGFTSSFCFCMPVGTPGNLIVQSVGKISTKSMVLTGLIPTITTGIIFWFYVSFYAPVIWPDLHKLPDWIHKKPKSLPIA